MRERARDLRRAWPWTGEFGIEALGDANRGGLAVVSLVVGRLKVVEARPLKGSLEIDRCRLNEGRYLTREGISSPLKLPW
jgi:hypothetical protein